MTLLAVVLDVAWKRIRDRRGLPRTEALTVEATDVDVAG